MFGNICRTFLLKLKLFQHRMYLKVYLVRCFRRGYDSELHFFSFFWTFSSKANAKDGVFIFVERLNCFYFWFNSITFYLYRFVITNSSVIPKTL